MATYVLIHGAGSDSWYWHLVAPRLRSLGHDVVAVDLPCEDDTAGLHEYADVVVDAVGYRARRTALLEKLAATSAERATRLHDRVVLEPMTAVERKIVHEALKDDPAVLTASEGTEPNRYVVVLPADG